MVRTLIFVVSHVLQRESDLARQAQLLLDSSIRSSQPLAELMGPLEMHRELLLEITHAVADVPPA